MTARRRAAPEAGPSGEVTRGGRAEEDWRWYKAHVWAVGGEVGRVHRGTPPERRCRSGREETSGRSYETETNGGAEVIGVDTRPVCGPVGSKSGRAWG